MNAITQPDEQEPQLGDDWFEQADGYVGDKLVSPGKRGSTADDD